MNIQTLYTLYQKKYLVDTDTRNIRNNSVFFALKGDNFNGNHYAKEAIDKGASFCVVDEEEFVLNDNYILVDDVLTVLQKLANYHRNQLDLLIIALTGSNGKTTSKELISSVLSKKYRLVATKGNLNNHIGVPLTLLSIKPDTEIAVVEMGANHPKEIEFLTSLVEPDYGYITNFGKAHLEGFGSIGGVVEAKSELYDYLITNNKTIFLNPEDEKQLEKTEIAKNKVYFDKSIKFIEMNPYLKLSYNNVEIQSNLIGDYNFTNIAAAITIGQKFKVDSDSIKNAITSYIPNDNRSQVIERGSNKIILDAYNANPTSMKSAINNFHKLIGGTKVVILGDMFELGETSHQEHQEIVDLVEFFNFDIVCFLGENFYKTNTKYDKFRNYKELSTFLKQNLVENAYILIKGSRGMKLERCLSIFTICSLCDDRPDCQ